MTDLSDAQGVSSEALCDIPCGEETCGGLGTVYSVYTTGDKHLWYLHIWGYGPSIVFPKKN